MSRLDERLVVAEHELGQRLGEQRLARRPVGPTKMKQPIGRFGSLRPARVRRIGLGDRLDGVAPGR
jgi:hypothetical protein